MHHQVWIRGPVGIHWQCWERHDTAAPAQIEAARLNAKGFIAEVRTTALPKISEWMEGDSRPACPECGAMRLCPIVEPGDDKPRYWLCDACDFESEGGEG